MKSLRGHIAENENAEGRPGKKPRRKREAPGHRGEAVRMIRSLGLDAATVALPAGVDLKTRAERMNQFWRTLVDFQYRDVLVVALCASER